MLIEHGKYLIKQSEDTPDICVYRGGRMVMHLSPTRFLNLYELKEVVSECMEISGLQQQDEMCEGTDYVYDGEEPC